MSSKHQFAPHDWRVLTRAPLDVWLAMSGVDIMTQSRQREADAFDRAAAEARIRYGASPLVVAVLDELVLPSAAQRKGTVSVWPDELLEELAELPAILDRVSACQKQAYTQFLLWFGDRIAHASSEGVVDCRYTVSQNERTFLHRLREVLAGNCT